MSKNITSCKIICQYCHRQTISRSCAPLSQWATRTETESSCYVVQISILLHKIQFSRAYFTVTKRRRCLKINFKIIPAEIQRLIAPGTIKALKQVSIFFALRFWRPRIYPEVKIKITLKVLAHLSVRKWLNPIKNSKATSLYIKLY